tara:strand:+ start:1657 stop:1950 length:294 start_codon:yes stop_codon:yes gene_type:complete
MPGLKEKTNISRARKAGYKGTDLAGAKKFLSNLTKKDRVPKAPKKNGPSRSNMLKKHSNMMKKDGNMYMKEAEGMFKKGISALTKASKFYKKHSKKK